MGNQTMPRIEIGIESVEGDVVFFVRDNGLGLALVKRIVELYEGRIWLESEGLGLGTCFRFTLPGVLT